jgi:hypothetical protein
MHARNIETALTSRLLVSDIDGSNSWNGLRMLGSSDESISSYHPPVNSVSRIKIRLAPFKGVLAGRFSRKPSR